MQADNALCRAIMQVCYDPFPNETRFVELCRKLAGLTQPQVWDQAMTLEGHGYLARRKREVHTSRSFATLVSGICLPRPDVADQFLNRPPEPEPRARWIGCRPTD